MAAKMPLAPEDFRTVVKLAPLVSIDLVVTDPEGRVLLGLRNNEPAKGFWFVPGGIIFKGERLETAFQRIVKTEIGLSRRMAEARHMGLFEHFYEANRFSEPGYGTHYIVNVFRLAFDQRQMIQADSQHRDMAWMLPGEILAAPGVHPHVKAYFAPSS